MKNTYFKLQFIVLFLFGFSLSFAQELPEFFKKSDVFFKTYVHNGKVDYKTIKSKPALLVELIEMAKNTQIAPAESNNYRAFWINAYNLTVINGIVSKYPVKSPLDIKGFFDTIKHDVAGKKLTLNAIENKMLRGQFNNDPRFHFVLVCAGLGCPPLINSAYMPSTLERQLDTQTKIAINNPAFIQVNVKKKKVSISQIFEWYTSDFTAKNNTIVNFINLYRTTAIPEKYKTNYYPYNWELNKLK